ncbi:DUF1330 domain-containing protein [Pseudorhodobacter sp.]|uniref:DUF1330 domain-containing protein n=1 Tax=Pseudorhodobacter sp. TaxID=1934400 RepID=UPI002649FAA5|nr:DUF1330 domain-containing protein [Pseudorhodobacter sp.]MDN5789126.1 DUF1330 domain-containing protein [Pseudorhodobacter sp.]
MVKGYWVAHVDIDDAQEYEKYKAANAAVFARYGARFLVRGAPQEQVEGKGRARTVVLEFPSLQAARDCYFSAEYQAAKALRDPVSAGDFVIVEGYDP